MKYIRTITAYLIGASNNNPAITTATILLFFIMFNLLESVVETLIFGERFEHWLDPFFIMGFMAYSAYSVWLCAVTNVLKDNPNINNPL